MKERWIDERVPAHAEATAEGAIDLPSATVRSAAAREHLAARHSGREQSPVVVLNGHGDVPPGEDIADRDAVKAVRVLVLPLCRLEVTHRD
ncbi:hypothetical protein [Actinomadura roseirufa]|uniref:hypothetical protein n=1 Tax=Actinomadura roseirufa TaxID=2094049 RepID=UPI001041077D|nr:hypothetical protein [Actinomadura roseirufa]